MKRRLFGTVCLLLSLGFLCTPTCRADTLLIGQISFDASGTNNSFDLYNLTAGLSNPDGIADNDSFSGTLTLNIMGVGQQVYSFSKIDSLVTGLVSPTIAVLPLGDKVTSATLKLTLSSSTGVDIFDASGNLAIVNLLAVPYTQLPLLTGSSLTPCDLQGDPCSQANIYANPAGVSPVPEPGTFWLVASAMSGITILTRRPFKA